MNFKPIMKTISPTFLIKLYLTLSGLCFLCCTDAPKETSNEKTNVLIIVADDMGEEVGCYGDPYARTPNIDQFAEEGVRFTNAYVTQASCSPSRSSILTGLFPHQNGQFGLSHRGISMHREYPNLFSILKKAGYTTGILGKLHVEPQEAFPYDYGVGGFDLKGPKLTDEQLSVEVVETDGTELVVKEKFTRYNIPVMADSAKAFIQRRGDKPFFLMMNFLDPHSPFRNQISGYPTNALDSTEVRIPEYCGTDNLELLQRVTGYYNGISRFDEGLGHVLRMLDSLNLRDNTLIVLLGDHGAPLPRAKATSYEAGLRIPMMAQFPGKTRKGTYDGFVSTIDILPTVLDVLDKDSVPENTMGISWIDLLENRVPERTYIAGEFTQHLKENLFPQRAITDGTFKLIYSPFASVYKNQLKASAQVAGNENPDTQSFDVIYERYAATPEYAFFDLRRDPYEFKNLADEMEYAEDLQHMKDTLRAWQELSDDPLLAKAYRVETTEQINAYITTAEELP